MSIDYRTMARQLKNKAKKQSGFSLAEAIMALLVLGIAAAGVLLPFAGGASAQAEGLHRTLASKLAGDLIEKIVATPFDQIISTFDGYAETKGQVKDAAGTVFSDSNYANFSRNAACEHVWLAQESGTTGPIFILATVTVSYNGTELAVIKRLISR